MRFTIVLLLNLLLMPSCSKSVDGEFFNGTIKDILEPLSNECLKGNRLVIEDIYTGNMGAFDTLIFFFSNKYPDDYMSMFNTYTGNNLGFYCPKGGGPDDFYSISNMEQFVVENESVKLWINDFNKNKISLLNLSNSATTHHTELDDVIDFGWRSSPYDTPFNFIFVCGDKLLYKNSPIFNSVCESNYTPSKYSLYDHKNKRIVREYELYKQPVYNLNKIIENGDYLHSIDRIKPDNKKIAMGMWMFPQINILDIETGELKGFRINKDIDFNYVINTHKKLRLYYKAISVDDTYIYALYSDAFIEDGLEGYRAPANKIHIFDWNGNFVRKITLDQKILAMTLDPVRKYLYCINTEDIIYYYDLSSSMILSEDEESKSDIGVEDKLPDN